jgi:hypothetical protein
MKNLDVVEARFAFPRLEFDELGAAKRLPVLHRPHFACFEVAVAGPQDSRTLTVFGRCIKQRDVSRPPLFRRRHDLASLTRTLPERKQKLAKTAVSGSSDTWEREGRDAPLAFRGARKHAVLLPSLELSAKSPGVRTDG